MRRLLEKQPKWLIIAVGLVMVAMIGGIDFFTGDYSLLIFYFIPVSLVSWFVGRRAGAVIAGLSGCTRFLSDFTVVVDARHLYWNSLQDFMFLLLIAFLVALLHQSLETDKPPTTEPRP